MFSTEEEPILCGIGNHQSPSEGNEHESLNIAYDSEFASRCAWSRSSMALTL